MATDGKIRIIITEGDGGGGGPGDPNGPNGKPKDKEDKLAKYLTHHAYHFIMNETKKVINHYIGNYGQRTGDYVGQANMQLSLNMVYQGIGIMTAAAAGFKLSGSPIGAAVGAGIATITSVTNFGFEYENYLRSIRIQNNEIALLRQRAGLDDGSRGYE